MIDIQVNGLVKSFEVGQNILDGITFQIDQGQRVGLLGKNGAGKSTAIKILTGLLPPSGGEARILGYDVVRQREAVKRRISSSRQSPPAIAKNPNAGSRNRPRL